jgi:NADH-quinone oxidoreductase subunit N
MGFNSTALAAMLPLVMLAGGGLLVLVAGVLARSLRSRQLALLTLMVTAGAAAFLWLAAELQGSYLQGTLTLGPFAVFGSFFLMAVLAVVVLFSADYVESFEHKGEFYALLLLGTAGGMSMFWTRHLLALFIGLEVLTLSSFVLAGYLRRDRVSTESALKFFLNGAFASAFLLYGMALVYGATGGLDFDAIAHQGAMAQTTEKALLFWAGGALMLGGLFFKMTVVPFHAWSPDVYQGAPTPVSAFLSVGSKGAAALVSLRLLQEAFQGDTRWNQPIFLLAAATMLFGNLAAIPQMHLKRMLAYSSIAHAGYMLLAAAALGDWSMPALMFYVAAYAAMNLGAFGAVLAFERHHGYGLRDATLRDVRGGGYRAPFVGALLALFMISLGGLPPTAGFMAKLYLFGAAVREGQIALVVISVLASAVSLYYYLRVVVYLYMYEPEESAPPLAHKWALSAPAMLALAVCAGAVLGLGLMPGRLLAWLARF